MEFSFQCMRSFPLGGRGSCRAVCGNRGVLLWCLGRTEFPDVADCFGFSQAMQTLRRKKPLTLETPCFGGVSVPRGTLFEHRWQCNLRLRGISR